MKGKTFKVVSNLEIQNTDGTTTNYLGCTAVIMHELPQSVAAIMYGGIPILIPKEKFFKSVQEVELKVLNYHESHEISLFLNTIFVTKFRTIFFEGEDIEEKAKDTALRLFKLKFNANYNIINTKLISTTGEKTMAKKQEQPEAVVTENVEQTGVALFEEQAKKINLPAVPTSFTLGGIEVSIPKIKKEVEEVLKLKLTDETDKKTYDKIKKKATELMKTRTSTKTFRNNIAKPINAWLKTLKSNIEDDVANAVKPGEDHCAEQMKIYEDWEAEQDRLEEERIEKQIQSRRELLQAVGGEMNVASFSWTFKHEAILIENEELADWDDEEFTEVYSELQKTFDTYKANELKKQQEAEAAKGLVSSTRKQMLTLMQYTQQGEVYTKNGHTITDAEIDGSDETTWMQLMMAHNTPKAEPVSPFAQAQANQPASTDTAPEQKTTFNPFEVKTQAPESTVEVAQTTQTGFAGFFSNTPASVNNNPELPKMDTMDAVRSISQDEAIETLFRDDKYVDYPLNQTTIRVFPAALKQEATAGVDIAFNGDFTNGLSFVIYKNK